MKAVVSWTMFVRGVIKGDIPLDELADANFYFSCHRSHVLGDREDGLVPHEATWQNKVLPSVTSHDKCEDTLNVRCNPDTVDPDLFPLVQQILAMIAKADAEGRVRWQIGNQPTLINTFDDDVMVYWYGRAVPASEYKKDWTP